jgi:N utilization substance protein A
MTNITLDQNTIRYISVFEKITKTRVRHEMFKKNLDVIEYSDDPERFLRNIFHNYKIKDVEIEKRGNKIHAIVSVESKDKGKIIGKDGRNLKLAREILGRHHDIQGLTIN